MRDEDSERKNRARDGTARSEARGESPSGNAPPVGGNDTPTISPPTPSLPKGGGAIRGIGEQFKANPATGTPSFSVPIFTTPGRGGFGPSLSLSYESGAGNG